jgi:hypothetical protein
MRGKNRFIKDYDISKSVVSKKSILFFIFFEFRIGLDIAVPKRKMDMQRLQQLLAGMPGRGNPAMDTPMPDTAEKIQISSLSLLKMLKHGKVLAVSWVFSLNCC